MNENGSEVRIRPGTLEDNNRVAIGNLLGRGYRMDTSLTLACSSEPFGRFEQYLFCAPALIL